MSGCLCCSHLWTLVHTAATEGLGRREDHVLSTGRDRSKFRRMTGKQHEMEMSTCWACRSRSEGVLGASLRQEGSSTLFLGIQPLAQKLQVLKLGGKRCTGHTQAYSPTLRLGLGLLLTAGMCRTSTLHPTRGPCGLVIVLC